MFLQKAAKTLAVRENSSSTYPMKIPKWNYRHTELWPKTKINPWQNILCALMASSDSK